MPESGEFQEGQRIIVEKLIHTEEGLTVPIGVYRIVEINQSLFGEKQCLIRSMPDEDVEAEVSLKDLTESARRDGL